MIYFDLVPCPAGLAASHFSHNKNPFFFPCEFGFSFDYKHCISLGFEHASSWFCFIPWSQIAKPLTYCIHRFGKPCFPGFSLVWLWTNWTVCGIGIAMGLQNPHFSSPWVRTKDKEAAHYVKKCWWTMQKKNTTADSSYGLLMDIKVSFSIRFRL